MGILDFSFTHIIIYCVMSVCPGKLKSRERERMHRGLGRTQVWLQKRKIYNALQALGWGCVDQWMGGWVVWELVNFPDLVRWAQAKWYLSLFRVFLKHSKTLGSPTYESKGWPWAWGSYLSYSAGQILPSHLIRM